MPRVERGVVPRVVPSSHAFPLAPLTTPPAHAAVHVLHTCWRRLLRASYSCAAPHRPLPPHHRGRDRVLGQRFQAQPRLRQDGSGAPPAHGGQATRRFHAQARSYMRSRRAGGRDILPDSTRRPHPYQSPTIAAPAHVACEHIKFYRDSSSLRMTSLLPPLPPPSLLPKPIPTRVLTTPRLPSRQEVPHRAIRGRRGALPQRRRPIAGRDGPLNALTCAARCSEARARTPTKDYKHAARRQQ